MIQKVNYYKILTASCFKAMINKTLTATKCRLLQNFYSYKMSHNGLSLTLIWVRLGLDIFLAECCG